MYYMYLRPPLEARRAEQHRQGGEELAYHQVRHERREWDLTVGFHNFNLRIFELRVSNPNKLSVDVFFDTMWDFNVPGSRPNKNTIKFRKSTVEWPSLLKARSEKRVARMLPKIQTRTKPRPRGFHI